MTPSLQAWPTKAKEEPSPHEARHPTGHQPSISKSWGEQLLIDEWKDKRFVLNQQCICTYDKSRLCYFFSNSSKLGHQFFSAQNRLPISKIATISPCLLKNWSFCNKNLFFLIFPVSTTLTRIYQHVHSPLTTARWNIFGNCNHIAECHHNFQLYMW